MSEESYEIQEAAAERDAGYARVRPPRDSAAAPAAEDAVDAVRTDPGEANPGSAETVVAPTEERHRAAVPGQDGPVCAEPSVPEASDGRADGPFGGEDDPGESSGGVPVPAQSGHGASPTSPTDADAPNGVDGTEAAGGADGAAGEGESPVGASGVASLELKPALEAVLMVVDEPATPEHLAKVLQRRPREVSDALRELADDYARQGRGFELRMVAGGWRYYTRAEYADAVESFVLDGQQARLTQAALETLAVVAYRQPVSRSRVSAVRGVNCDGVMRTLLQRGLLEEAGTEPETGAILYRTTHYFLERMGLRGLDELPELAPFLPEAEAVEGDSQEGVPSFDVDDSGDLSQTDH